MANQYANFEIPSRQHSSSAFKVNAIDVKPNMNLNPGSVPDRQRYRIWDHTLVRGESPLVMSPLHYRSKYVVIASISFICLLIISRRCELLIKMLGESKHVTHRMGYGRKRGGQSRDIVGIGNVNGKEREMLTKATILMAQKRNEWSPF